jgi:hypothetical protein
LKRITIFLLLVSFLVAAGYFYYHNYMAQRSGIWNYVPGSAVLTYESEHAIDVWNNLLQTEYWSSLSEIASFRKVEDKLYLLDSLTGKSGALDKLSRNIPFLVSFHVVSSGDFDVVYYLDIKKGDSEDLFNEITTKLRANFKMEYRNRVYQGNRIHEIKEKSAGKTFSYFIHDDYWIGSFTPFLVEDVIRNIENGFKNNFQSSVADLSKATKLKNDDGNLYVNYREWPQLMNVFLLPDAQEHQPSRKFLATDVFLDIKFSQDAILMNGTSFTEKTQKDHFLDVFKDQNPAPIGVTEFLPQKTAWVFHMGFANTSAFVNQVSRFWAKYDESMLDSLLDFQQKYQFSFEWIDREIAIVKLDDERPNSDDRLIFLGAKNGQVAFDELKSLTQKVSEGQGDSVYFENYAGFEIIQLPLIEWPSRFLGNNFNGFENTFFLHYQDYVLLGNSMQALKDWITDVEEEDTWGKSVRINLFLENTLGQANMSYFVNLPRSWRSFLKSIKPDWQNHFDQYRWQWQSLDLMAFQVSNLDDRYYTNIAIGHERTKVPLKQLTRFEKLQSVYTMNTITHKPEVVRNHNNQRLEVLLQDSANVLYQVSNDGQILWGDTLDSPVKTDVHQIDYYKNGKLQYIFATEKKLHLIDRNGNDVEDFPAMLDDGIMPEFLSVVDYDNSKRYRFMLADNEGRIWLYDKNKKALNGWKGKDLGGRFAAPPTHIRVKGGDCMIGIQKAGLIHVMNRRGEYYSGFPINLQTGISGEYFVEMGSSFEKTFITVVTETGKVYRVNLKGQVVSQEQLYKPSKESRFRLVKDALKKDYIIVRQDYNQLSFINTANEEIFEQNFLASGELDVQYYNFQSGNDLLIVHDKEQEFAYFYNAKGQMINFEPVECSHPVAVLYYSKEKAYRIYLCYRNNLNVLSLKQ